VTTRGAVGGESGGGTVDRMSIRWGCAAVAVISLGPALTSCTFGPSRAATTTTTATTTTVASTTTTSTIPPTTTTSTTTTSTTTIPPTTTTTIPMITEGAVIIVANASGVTGAAALLGQELSARGFHVGNPTNGAGNEEKTAVSKVYFLPAGADVAASVGRVMGDIPVTRMPVPVGITGGPAQLGDATVVVMLGSDLASHKPIVPRA
jgi:hypothetical protein